MRQSVAAVAVVLGVTAVAAQTPPFAYPAPPASSYVVSANVPYGGSGADVLHMDVYRPSRQRPGPALVFFNTASGADRAHPFYVAWARLAASRGITAILPDLRSATYAQDFAALLQHLAALTGDPTIDPEAVAVYAGSGNVSRALPLVQDPKSAAVKSAVMYYGDGSVTRFRLDLPMLYVRAGLDRPPVNRAILDLVSAAVAQHAPVTLLNHANGYHAFEMVNDDDATREVMDRTLEFVARTTAKGYQAALRQGMRESIAAGYVATGQFPEAAAAYAGLVAARPEDGRLRLAYGEALLGAGEFATACAEMDKLKGKGLGYRDLGLPAARACMQKGDAEAALAWLQSIPQRFLPAEIEKDPIFTAIRERADFRVLFAKR